MEQLNLLNILSIIRKRSGKLNLPLERNLDLCLENARSLAAYFFQQYGLSGEAARIIEGIWLVTVFDPKPEEAEEIHLYPMLMIDDTAIIPVDTSHEDWVLLEPHWELFPKPDGSSEEAVVMPVYQLEPPLHQRMKHSLYDAVVSAVLYHLYDSISGDMQGLTKDYLDATAALDTNESEVLLDTLVVPSLKMLLDRLPYLRTDRWDKVYVEKDPDRIRVYSQKVNFDYLHSMRTWLVQVQSGNTWSDLNPLSFNPLTVVQLLHRRDFLPVFLNAAATLITRRKIEIEREILAAKAAK